MTTPVKRPVILMRDIVKTYYIGQPNELEILHGIDLTVQTGEFLSIVGESGSGKSTLMNVIGALDRPTSGTYELDGEEVDSLDDATLSRIRNKKIGFVFQSFNLIPRVSALENVEVPLLYAGVPSKERRARAMDLLTMVGMEDRADHQPNELSGGQNQRVAIARAMANDPAILLADEPTGALDSETSHLVMDLFHQLHEERGKTIVLLTHSNELAAEAERIVKLSGGRIVADSGIPAVITITALGSSLQKTLELSFQSIGGTNQIQAFMNFTDNSDSEAGGEYYEWKDEDYISFEDLEAFQEAFDGRVRNVVLESMMGDATATFPENVSKDPGKVSIIGTTSGYLENHSLKLLRGRDLTARDQSEKKSVALVSDLFVKYVCGGQSPIGKAIDLEQQNGQVARVYVVGVYRFDRTQLRYMTKGDEGSKPVAEKDIPTNILLPYLFMKENLNDEMYSEPGISDFAIMAEPGEDVAALQEDIKAWFAENKWADNGNFTLETWSSMEDLEQIQNVLRIVTLVIAVIAAISLLVGGVGVMNIMLVSVVERTKEIGIRKALGAQNRDIERQFLSETVFICLIGGLLGVLLGLILGFVGAEVGSSVIQSRMPEMEELSHVTVHPSMPAILVSVGFSMLTGLVFGLYPARRAARMSPIDALRYE